MAGRQIKVTDPLGRYVESTYDLAGRRTVEQHRDSGDALALVEF